MSMLDSEKVYTGVGFLSLVEPDISIRSTRKQLNFTTENMKDWNQSYWGWKHGYKKRYSKTFLEKRGYASQSYGRKTSLNKENLEAYCVAEIPDYKEMLAYDSGAPINDFEMRLHLQENSVTWSNRDNLLDDIWVYQYTRYEDDGWGVDDTNFLLGIFHHIDNSSEEKQVKIPNMMEDPDWLTVQYKKNAADDDEWFIFIENKENVYQNVYEDNEPMVLTPIITLKTKEVIKPDTWDLNRMMRKLNVDADAFEESLNQKVESGDTKGEDAVDSAYLMNGLPLYNPYEVLPGTYKVTEGDNLPYVLIKRTEDAAWQAGVDQYKFHSDYSPGEKEYIIDLHHWNQYGKGMYEYVKGTHVITQEDSEWYYNKHLKEQAYLARALFKTFAYYASRISKEYMEKTRPSERFMGKGTVDDFHDIIGAPAPTSGLYIPRGDGGIVVEQDSVRIAFGYSINVETFSGKVRPSSKDGREQSSFTYQGKRKGAKNEEGDRKEWTTPGYDSTGNKLIIKVQVDEYTHQVMTIWNFNGSVNFDTKKSGWRYHELSYVLPLTESRLPIPLFVLYNNSFREYVTIYEHSLVYMAFSIDIVVVKWYKKFAGIFLAIAFCFYTAGTGCSIAGLIYNLVIGLVVSMLLQKLLELVDSDILKVIIQFAVMIAQMALGGFDFSAMTSEAFLQLAVNVGTMAMNTFQATALKEAALAKREKDFQDGYDEKMAALDSSMNLLPRMELGAHSSFTETQGAQPFYDLAFGEGSLYNYDQYYDVDGEIELRKQVKSG